MEPRFAFSRVAPEALSTLLGMEKYLWACNMDEGLLELLRIRVSQINGCAYCLEMHTKVARGAGETEERLNLLSVWRDAGGLFSSRECAALALAEAMTKVDPVRTLSVPDEIYMELRKHFTDHEISDLTWVVIAINHWNRFAIAFQGFDQGTVRSIYRAKKQARARK